MRKFPSQLPSNYTDIFYSKILAEETPQTPTSSSKRRATCTTTRRKSYFKWSADTQACRWRQTAAAKHTGRASTGMSTTIVPMRQRRGQQAGQTNYHRYVTKACPTLTCMWKQKQWIPAKLLLTSRSECEANRKKKKRTHWRFMVTWLSAQGGTTQ